MQIEGRVKLAPRAPQDRDGLRLCGERDRGSKPRPVQDLDSQPLSGGNQGSERETTSVILLGSLNKAKCKTSVEWAQTGAGPADTSIRHKPRAHSNASPVTQDRSSHPGAARTMSQAEITPCSAPQRVFQEAVKKGNTKELHSLLQNMTNCEFNVNSFGPEGQTALHQSVIDGNLELVKLLVKFGADIRLANREGWSALHIAAFGGHQDIVLYLITKAKYASSAR
ncbi:notch-regulated ankyrin repeat-containing protein [Arapaima gigas]